MLRRGRSGGGLLREKLDALSISEAAYIAALPKAPSSLHPDREPDRAIAARNRVIAEMERAGSINGGDAASAQAEPLGTRHPIGTCPAP